MTVDLGCGATKRAAIGIDRVPGPGVDYVLTLGFDPLPFADGTVEAFVAYDLLEHIPGSVWVGAGGRWTPFYPRIFLLREIYRCLQPGGTFTSQTPTALPEWAQDPTHEAPPWVAETWDYFCGRQPVAAQYGIDFAFELVECQPVHHHLRVVVRKPAR